MSHYMTALAMKQQGLKPATKIVLYWLADCHNQETGKCFPSINHLASVCEMSRRSVEGHLMVLEQLGLIKRYNQFRDRGGKTSNSYVLELLGINENNSSTDTDAQNLRMVCAKSAYGDAQNLRMNNLGINNIGNITNNTSSNDDGYFEYFFEEVWEAYPRKVGKGAAKKALKAAMKKVDDAELQLKLYNFCAENKDKDQKFVPHMATWLNQERWADEV